MGEGMEGRCGEREAFVLRGGGRWGGNGRGSRGGSGVSSLNIRG